MTRDSFLSAGWVVGQAIGRRRSTARVGRRPMAWPRNAIRPEVEPASIGADHEIIAPHPCMRWDPVGSRTMMQICASVAKLRSSGRPFFFPARKPLGGTSDRYLESFMADRRSKAPARQNLFFSSCRFWWS